MPWIEQKYGYKVVTPNMCSFFSLRDREMSSCGRTAASGKGKVLLYKVGERTNSPNGICSCQSACCRGIHAYLSLKEAKRVAELLGCPFKILKVEAGRWWNGEYDKNRIKAASVTVIKGYPVVSQK